MCELTPLLRLELRSLYGFNRFRYTKDRKEKRRSLWMGVAWVFLAVVIVSYVCGLVYGLTYLGLGGLAPSYLAFLSSFLVLAFGLFRAGHAIFGSHGYALLTALPIRSDAVVLSRFAGLYVEDLVLCLVVMVPGIITYGILQGADASAYILALLGTILMPLIPLAVSTLFGTLITALSARAKHKSLVQTVLSVGVVVVVLPLSFSFGTAVESLTPELFSSLAETVSDILGLVYPPCMWLGDAVIRGNILSFALYTVVSVAVAGLIVWLTARYFHSVMERLSRVRASHSYKVGELTSRSLRKALYLRELKRYFSSSVYVTNTIIGPIMGFVMSAALCFVDLTSVTAVLPIDVVSLAPFVIAAVFCMMTTTSTSISMEGREVWIVKSLPVPTEVLLDSKALLNLSLMLPFYILSEGCLIYALRPNILEAVWLILIPPVIMVFSVIFGLTVDLKFHRFDWDKEETIVKQSISAAIGGFGGFLLALLLTGVVLAVPTAYGWVVKLSVCIVLSVSAWLLRRKNNAHSLTVL